MTFEKGFTPWNKGKFDYLFDETLEKMSIAKKGYIPWNKGKHLLEKTKRKMSLARLGKSPWNKGKKLPEETKRKISLTLKGHIPWNKGKKGYFKHSEKYKRERSLAMMGKNHPFFGKHHSDESKKKMSISNGGKNHPFYGKKLSAEHKRKISFSLFGHEQSKETRQKISFNRIGKMTRDKHPFWKGGIWFQQGYKMILCPDHPYADKHKYIREHRLIMEKKIGRYLKPEEVVHHINRIKSDNRIGNLMLFKNNAEHLSFHKFCRHKTKSSLS